MQTVNWAARIFCGAALATALVGGRAQASPRPSAFTPGEQSTYSVQYLGLRAGSAQITVGSQVSQWGQAVWPIITLAKTESIVSVYPLRDRFVSYWDAAVQKSIGSELVAEENHRHRWMQIHLDHKSRTATVVKQKEGEAADKSSYVIEEGTADLAAATFLLRNQPLQVGKTFDFPLFTGAKSFVLHATVEAIQPLQTRWGKRQVLRVRAQTSFSGKLQTRRDTIAYFTADEAHIPVRIEANFLLGTLCADLVDYKPGIGGRAEF